MNMKNNTTKRALVALAFVMAFSAIGANSFAAIAGKFGNIAQVTRFQPQSDQTAQRQINTGTNPQTFVGSYTNVQVQGIPTGDSPGDQEVCNSFAGNIDLQLNRMAENLANGDGEAAISNQEAIENTTANAKDAGCKIVY